MLVVHGLVTVDGGVACWAEAAPAGPHGRRRSVRRAEPHPFAVAPPVAGVAGSVVVELPSVGSAPCASPESVTPTRARGVERMLPWQVPVVHLPAGDDLEAALEAADGVRAGASVGWLADLVWLTGDLVRRGRVLPGIVGAEARWRAVLTGHDAHRFESLHRAMPGVARAATPGVAAADAARSALDRAVDALVRATLPGPLLQRRGDGVEHAWLAALTGSEPTVDGDGDVAALRERLDRWAAGVTPAPLRTCLRLSFVDEFPDTEQSGWLLEFLLQPLDEPGLLVPAEQVWRDAASPLMRWADYPQEVLLADLGRASRLYPDLTDALRASPRPVEQRLDTAGAYRFLTHATVLSEAGFGVLLPAQWQRRQEFGLTLTVHSGEPARPVLRDTTTNRAEVVKFKWGLALGEQYLSEADLAELARAKVPLVRLRGRWVHLDPERLRAGLLFLARGGSGEMTAGEAMRLTRIFPETDLPLPVTDVDGTGWVADLLTGRAPATLELIDPPASFRGELRPYQRAGLSWLAFLDAIGIGALLADDMGLGKTVQVLALEAHRRATGKKPPTLVVCPLSVLGNWRREIERFTPSLKAFIYHGSARTPSDSADLILTTYQVAARDADVLAATEWDRIVLDEAQHVKNASGQTARALRRLPARHRVALTGTPVENRLTELWSIADFLNPGILGPASIFRARYSVPVERYADADAAARLRRATRPFLLRREKTDRAVIADLPRKLDRRQWCTLTTEQVSLYQAVVDELLQKTRERNAGARHKGLVLSAITKLKQVCNHPAHLLGDGTSLAGRSGKVDRLEEILANAVADGDRVLVFTQYAAFGAMLAPYLSGRLGLPVPFLHGGTTRGGRDAMVAGFQALRGPGVMLLSVKAGGTGLNLTAATQVVHLDRWWNPAVEAQATDRAYRIGQDRDVQVHTLICVGTIEERIDTVMSQKRAMAGLAVGSEHGWLAGLSTDDIADLIALTPEAAALTTTPEAASLTTTPEAASLTTTPEAAGE